MTYMGGKSGSGVWQWIVNQIPPHRVYVEPFVGGGAILRLKKPAPGGSIALDLDAAAIAELGEAVPHGTRLIVGDGLAWLEGWNGWNGDEFCYLDPPYLHETRRSRHRYAHEFSRADHQRLLRLVNRLPCMVAISGYWSDLYAAKLKAPRWRVVRHLAVTRGGTRAEECLWCNYPAPDRLHDYRAIGADYREREKLARRRRNLLAKLRRMTPLERRDLLEALKELDP